MPAFSTAIAVGVAVLGAGLSYKASQETAAAQKSIAQESQRAEAVRAEQLRLDSIRKQRDTIRNLQISRSRAAVVATNQGAMESSSFFGGQADMTGQALRQIDSIKENQNLGNQLFEINSNIAGFQADAITSNARAQFGKDLFNSSQAIGRIGGTVQSFGSSLFEPSNPWKTTVSRG